MRENNTENCENLKFQNLKIEKAPLAAVEL